MRAVRKQENPVKTVSVTKPENKQALQDVLAARMGLSRNAAKRMIDRRGVLVNGKRVWMARHELHFRDTITTLDAPEDRQARPPIRILAEGPGWLVANKPAGMLSLGENSVEEQLRTQRQCPGLRVVHRLDRDTSGCLLAVENDAVWETIITAFKEGTIHKTYRAIVAGRLKNPETTLKQPIEGLKAVTHLRTLDACEEVSHIAAKIETGRTHQIRKHLAALGHPLVGDRQYAQHILAKRNLLEVDRQMLHAAGLGFPNPNGGPAVHVNSPLPADFTRCLRQFGLR